MNPRARVFVACVVVGAVGGVVKAAWTRPEGDRNYPMNVVAGAIVGLVAGAIVAELAFPGGPGF